MRELSLNILDIAQNSISAGASLITIDVSESREEHLLTLTVSDNGCGMDEEQLQNVCDPFFTTRTTRKVGMGIPLFRLAAEQTGGSFEITSKKGVGTSTKAVFHSDSIDFTPLGDMTSTVTVLISMNTDRDFIYRRSADEKEFVLDTREIKKYPRRRAARQSGCCAVDERIYRREHSATLKNHMTAPGAGKGITMKSLAELNAIRDKAKANMNIREDNEYTTRVLVGMATCGIAAGAKPVLTALVDEIARRNLSHVTVSQTGCIGMCQYEPIVEVLEPGKEKVTYVKVTPEMVARIVSDHLVNGNPVGEFTVGAIAK